MTKHRPAPAELLSFPSALALPEPLVPANVDLPNFTPKQAILSGEPA